MNTHRFDRRCVSETTVYETSVEGRQIGPFSCSETRVVFYVSQTVGPLRRFRKCHDDEGDR